MLGQVQMIIDVLIDVHMCIIDNGHMKWMLLTYACRAEKLISTNGGQQVVDDINVTTTICRCRIKFLVK